MAKKKKDQDLIEINEQLIMLLTYLKSEIYELTFEIKKLNETLKEIKSEELS